jgi:hypothetical protein
VKISLDYVVESVDRRETRTTAPYVVATLLSAAGPDDRCVAPDIELVVQDQALGQRIVPGLRFCVEFTSQEVQ